LDFSFTEEQQMLQESVQKFVQKNYDFEVRKKLLDSEKGYSEQNWALFAELGWLTVPFAEEDGGFGGSAVDLMVMMEAFGKAMLVEPFLPTTVLAGGLISQLGSAEQKAELLPQIMEGSLQLACAFGESGSRYNLASVQTSAKTSGDDTVLNGKKIAVLNGCSADRILVVARTSGEERDRDGISVFIVSAGEGGVSINRYTNVDGQRAAEITLNGVKVSSAKLLGEQGSALTALETAVDRATLAVSAEAVGAMDAMLQKTVEYSKVRKQFGTPIGTFQALQHRMADMFIECQLARSIVLMAAMKLDSGASETEKAKAVSAAKSRIGRAIRKVGQEAVQIHGAVGVTDELDIGHLFKRVTAINVTFGNPDFHTARYSAL
jgi:alkylation response protein AidB-like acyl-CoA dehydrogenase|tara:strand:+ start:16674 stop:17807 length:1134 start_codon:yes stop_codon:yes gene_type:complete